MKTYTHLGLLFLLFSLSCKIPLAVESSQAALLPVRTEAGDTLSDIEQILRPYRDSLSGKMNEVIGDAGSDFKKERPFGSLGYLVVDAMSAKARDLDSTVSHAICNYGGIRLPEMKKGPIKVGKIFELLPFDNELVLLDVKGDILIKWLQFIDSAGGWPVWKSFDDRANQPGAELRQTKQGRIDTSGVTVIQPQIDPAAVYVIATNDYVANGGDNCSFLKQCKRRNTGLLIRDLLIEFIRFHQTVYPANLYQIKTQ